MAAPLPRALGPYRILDLIGTGATARVLRALAPGAGAPVALKWLHRQAAETAVVRDAFAAEVELLARLDHPGLPKVLGSGEDEGCPWVAMELAEGTSLEARARLGTMPWPDAVAYGIGALEVLAYLHAQGIVHRDIKPANLVIDQAGRVRVLDLGIAVVMTGRPAPATGEAGTPRYMSPEQVLGLPLGPASDLYSIGLCLFEAIAGRGPYPGSSGQEAALLAAHAHGRPRRLSQLVQVPQALDAIIAGCLAKPLELRYTSARALVADLRQIAADPALPASATLAGHRLGLEQLRGDLPGRSREMGAVRRWLMHRPRPDARGSMLVIRGSQGAGKSALLAWAEAEALRAGVPVVGATSGVGSGAPVRLLDDQTELPVRRAGERLLAVIAADVVVDAAAGCQVIQLGPLGPGAIARWVREDVGIERVDRQDLAALQARSGGWPSRLEPMLFRWRARHMRGEGPPPGGLLPMLEEAAVDPGRTRSLLAAFEEESRLLLELGAWLHPCPADGGALVAAGGTAAGALPRLLSACLRRGLEVTMEADALVFKDAALARTIQEQSSPDLRADLLAAALEILASRTDGRGLRRRAELLLASGDAPAAVACAFDAAERLGAEYRRAEAGATVTDFIEHVARPLAEREAELVGVAVRHLGEAGELDRAVALLDRTEPWLAEGHRDPLVYERATLLWRLGRLDEAKSLYLGVAARARRRQDRVYRFRALQSLAVIDWGEGRLRRAVRLLERLAPLSEGLSPLLRVAWLRRRTLGAVEIGDTMRAGSCLEQAWQLARAHDLESELMGLAEQRAFLHFRTGELKLAETALHDGIERALRLDHRERLAGFRNLLGTLHLQAGDAVRAAVLIRSSLRTAFSVGAKFFIHHDYELLARIAAARGRLSEARRCLRLSRRHGAASLVNEAYMRLAETDLALLEGDPEVAATHLAAADAIAGSFDAEARAFREVLAGLVARARGEAAAPGDVEALAALRPTSFAFRLPEFEARLSARPATGCAR